MGVLIAHYDTEVPLHKLHKQHGFDAAFAFLSQATFQYIYAGGTRNGVEKDDHCTDIMHREKFTNYRTNPPAFHMSASLPCQLPSQGRS